jgi:phage gp37-like protein
MAFIRKIKTKSGTYLAEVESYRDNGKVRQRVLRYVVGRLCATFHRTRSA